MGQKRLNNLDDMVVTARVISNMFDCTERWVRSLASEGIIDKEKSGSYKLQPTVKKYINHLKTSVETSTDEAMNKEEYWTEKTLHEKAKREIAELELAKMKGTMHKAEDVEEVMTDMLSRLKSKLIAIPSKMAPLLGEERDINKIQNLLDEEVFMALEELSDYTPELFLGDEYIALEEDKDDVDGEDN